MSSLIKVIALLDQTNVYDLLHMILCRAQACIPACQKYGVHDGEAFLLERLGDVTSALNLYVRNIEQCNATFVEETLSGHVQLPNMTASGSRYATSHHAVLSEQQCPRVQELGGVKHRVYCIQFSFNHLADKMSVSI